MNFSNPYEAYTYAYPHKTAYRRFSPSLPLEAVWEAEPRQSLFMYLHIPFCEYRCGFCNLFTLAQPEQGLPHVYLNKLEEQAHAFMNRLPDSKFSQLAIGGGTPTYLNTIELQRLLRIITDILHVDPRRIPVSCEASPATIDYEKLTLLREWGVDRISIGIQSFRDEETRSMGRPQRAQQVDKALELLRQFEFPICNLDLIYGAEEQTIESWLESVDRSIEFGAQELFLYPLYVRRLTGLGQRAERRELIPLEQVAWDAFRMQAYEKARDRLLAHGYKQISMRNFRLESIETTCIDLDETTPAYCCQRDGMVGLGSGARSYTRQLHYSGEYAVGSQAVKNIVGRYLNQPFEEFQWVDYGFSLSEDDQRRRFLLMSLLQVSGIDRSSYASRFRSDVLVDFPQLQSLVEDQLLTVDVQSIRLTGRGIALSDAIGPWLYSDTVHELSQQYQWS